jgi:polysaccharide chain length determinant protein (PEP-CTERM system associated)
MNLLVEEVLEEVRGAWRFRWWALLAAWVLGVIGWTVVMLLPDMYEGRATVFVDTRTALRPVLQGLAVEQDVDAELNFVRQSLLGAPQLEKIARDVGLLNPALKDVRERVSVIDGLRDRIAITVTSAAGGNGDGAQNAGSIYGIVYQDRNRARSLKVVGELLNTLIVDTLGGKRQGSEDAQKFLETQIRDYETRLRAAEDKLAEFKKHNVGAMPTEQGGYFTRLQTEMDAVKTAQTALSVAMSRREELSRQLSGEPPLSTAAPAGATSGAQAGPAGAGDTLSRIRETQAHLDELLLNYTDKHPDVIAARQTLAELNARRASEVEALRRGDASAVANSGATANPVYQSIQLALNQTDVEIASLRRQLGDHQSRVTDLRRALDTMPKVEAEYAQLNRDYDVNKTQYTALLTQLEKAKLSQEADTNGSVRFEIVEPPNAEYRPVWPHRSLLVLVVLAVSLAAGAGLSYLIQLLKPVFWSVRTLAEASGATVLGAVSPAFPQAMLRRKRWDLAFYTFFAGSFLLVAAVVLGFSLLGEHLTLPPNMGSLL